MNCHECARDGLDVPAVSECRFCFVGLCKDHLVASLHGQPVPQYGCAHHPERAPSPSRHVAGRPTASTAA